MKEAIKRTVYFIGAGPGNPDLLTVKAAKILAQADAVVVDRLVSSDLLQEYVHVNAEIFPVGKQGHCDASTKQSAINERLVLLAKKYTCTVRLKGGDIAFFSNILDEIITMNEHNISYEIVPGITAASAASAYTAVPLTARGYATGVLFISCCSHDNISDEEWRSLAQMNNTLVWYMSAKQCPRIARKLIFAGADLKLPLLVIEQASTSKQYVHQFRLEDFLSEQTTIDFMSPSMVIVGKVAALYDRFSWFNTQSDRSAYFQPLQLDLVQFLDKDAERDKIRLNEFRRMGIDYPS